MDFIPSPPPPPLTESFPSRRRSNARRLLYETTATCLSHSLERENHVILSPPPPYRKKSSISPSIDDASDHVPLRELFLLSPSFGRRLQMDLENVDPDLPPPPPPPRRRRKNRSLAADTGEITQMEIALPWNTRRSRKKRLEDGKRVEPSVPQGPSSPAEMSNDDGQQKRRNIEGVWGLITDIMMWKEFTKSSLGFGFGLFSLLSYSFTKYLNLNIISTTSHVGLLVLAMAFFYDSFFQRYNGEEKQRRLFQLKEEDVLRFTRVVLPTANTAIAMAQDIFSGEASTTLKVVPVLLFTAKYGQSITLWRLFAIGFFISFTLPKLYSCYPQQIQRLGRNMNSYVCETWKGCQHKKIVTFSAATMVWNMFGVKQRFTAAFIAIVIIRYYRQFRQEDNGVVESVQEHE